jgi:PKD repeat protein
MRPWHEGIVGRRALGCACAAVMGALVLAGCGGGSTVVVTGPSGSAIASVGPSGQVSVSSSGGGIAVGTGKLPEGWPASVGVPEGFTVLGAATSSVSGKPTYTATLQAPGDATAAVNTWLDGLKAAGFVQEPGIGGTTGAGSVTILKGATDTVTVIRTVNNNETGIVVGVKPVQ